MVAQDSGYSRSKSPARARAHYAGVNLPAPKRGDSPQHAIDKSFEGNPERQVEAKTILVLVRECIAAFPQECQYAKFLFLHVRDGVPIREIADMMDCAHSTAQTRLKRTMIFIGAYIREHE